MLPLRERIILRIGDKICSVCIFQGADGQCFVPDPRACAILRNVDGAIDVVREVHSDKMDPYVNRLREMICSACPQEDPEGNCALRVRADCPLEDYFGMLVEIIEEELKHNQAS